MLLLLIRQYSEEIQLINISYGQIQLLRSGAMCLPYPQVLLVSLLHLECWMAQFFSSQTTLNIANNKILIKQIETVNLEVLCSEYCIWSEGGKFYDIMNWDKINRWWNLICMCKQTFELNEISRGHCKLKIRWIQKSIIK